ncbi:Histone-lysine N-methyltransferase set-6 [Vermiconidia calcicola]|uniref:Histone-lysine N-methyltransferase set-6 n=1 Tax=Vermiconidia calcicola TaxID=1690605 RepID=A0ACC3N1G1_9PEZI|nr:Histone-lysine N-methyltransferase set-6 [Vermiconidia calcicola]
MSPPISGLFAVQDVVDAGRGVIAISSLSQDTVVFKSEQPSAHVLFRQYRKEVCARCFSYDRGRTLPIRDNAIGKVFCTRECQSWWVEEQGRLGSEAWKQLHSFLQLKSKVITNAHGLPMLAAKPTRDEVQAAWDEAEDRAGSMRRELSSASQFKADKVLQRALQQSWSQAVDPDILSYLLSGILEYARHPEQWQTEVSDLAMDETPYRSIPDLKAQCDSFLQLTAITPVELLPSVTPQVCQTLINAASHNSFGIHSGSEDGDEYLGYGLYPEASYFNHSCRPNIAKRRVGSAWEFRAIRDIDIGEECCITYLGGDEKELTVVERRSRLKQFWGFESPPDIH